MKAHVLNSISRESLPSPFFFASLLFAFAAGDIAIIILGTKPPPSIIYTIGGFVFSWSCLHCGFGRAQEVEREGGEVDMRWGVVGGVAWCFFLIIWLFNCQNYYSEDPTPYWVGWAVTLGTLVEVSISTLAWIFLRKGFSLWFKGICTENTHK